MGENNDVIDYLSKRLGYDVETTRFIAMRHESVLKVRVTKVDKWMDSFSSNDIQLTFFYSRSKKF